MTIITAKTPHRRALKLTPLKLAPLKLAPLALAAMLLSAEAHADWKLTPRIDLRETYSDNLGLQNGDATESGFISEAAPSATFSMTGRRLNLTGEAGWRMYSYSNKDAPNLRNSERHYNAAAKAIVADDWLFLDAGATGSRQAISAFGPVSSSSYSSRNTTDVSTWQFSPYLRHRFGSTADLTMRYARDSVDAGVAGFGTSLASTRSADLTSGTRFSSVGWNLNYYQQDLSDRVAGDSSSETATAGLRWNLIRRFSLTATGGYDKFEYPTINQRTNGRSWTGGFVWTPSTRTSVQASFGRRYFGKTGSLASSYRTQRSVWSLDYSDAITTSRSQFVLPAAIDTASMLDAMFTASFPDPVQRQQAVQAYIASAGLPSSLANSINYLSNRYIRIKRLQGAAIFRGARSNLSLSVFSDQRNALSTQQSDSALLGGQIATLNDNTRQRGASANYDYRLTSRTSAYVGANLSRVTSLTTDVVNNISETRIGMNHRFAAKTNGSLELRRARGRQDLLGNSSYHETAVMATFSVLY